MGLSHIYVGGNTENFNKENMSDRFSVLRPLTISEQELFAIELCNFFSPMNYEKNCEILGIPKESGSIKPFSFGQFLHYLDKNNNIKGHKYQYHLGILLHKFKEHALFNDAGSSSQGSPPFHHCYYSQLELTNRQKNSIFWLGRILGESFLKEKYKPFIVRIEGHYKDGESGTGSGILINNNTILTCRHNLTDLEDYKCYLGERELEISDHKYHDIHDIGIIKLKNLVPSSYYPYFGMPYELDETLTMGYPPLRGMREAALISQKGEINAISKDWQNSDCITISSTVRPGNSGGPVISKSGYIVGIVTQYANSASSISAEKDGFKDNHSIPFYNAIASTSIIKILSELDNDIPILFENYE